MKLLSISHVDYNGLENLVNSIMNYMGKKAGLISFEIDMLSKKAKATFSCDELKYNYDKIREIRDLFKYCYALGIADYIVDNIEKELIKKIIASSYTSLTKTDKDLIIQNIGEYCTGKEFELFMEPTHKLNRKAKIIFEITKFIDDNDHMDLEGFINFRLRYYLDELNDLVDIFVEKLEMEKEYNEFIKLLKYFVDIQPSKIEEVKLIINSPVEYRLLTIDDEVIDKDYVMKLIDDFGDTPLSEDDFLISCLISLSPKKILVYNAPKATSEIYDTIYKIFDGRVSFCRDNNQCRNDNFNV